MTKHTKHRLAGILVGLTAISMSGVFPMASIAVAAVPATIWSDGFESNDFSEWDIPVGPQWEVNTGSITGFRAGAMTADTEGPDSALTRSQSTEGFEHIKLSYWYKAVDFSPTDTLKLEYTVDGTTWTPLSTINEGLDDHVIREVLHMLPLSASDNEDFALRFVGKINGEGAEVWIDDVTLSGEAINGEGDTSDTSTSGTTTTATTTTTAVAACADSTDNDGDGLADLNDPGCADLQDNDETDSSVGVITGTQSTGTATTSTATTTSTSSGTGTTTATSTSNSNTTGTSTAGATNTATTTTLTTGTTTGTSTTTSPEGSYLTCDDNLDNDLDGEKDVADLDCLVFRPTATIVTQVIGGTATASDFLFRVLFGTIPSATTTGSTTGVDMTWPFIGTWQVIPISQVGYNTTFGNDCAPSGFFEMLFNAHKNCLLINTFGTATSTGTTTGTTTGGGTGTTTATSTTPTGNTGTTTATTTPTSTNTSTSTGTSTATSTGTTMSTTTPSTTSTTTTTNTSTNTNTTGTGTTGTSTGVTPPACADGSDNDGDGLADLNDPGCDDSLDNTETDSLVGVITPPASSSTSSGTTTATSTTQGSPLMGNGTTTATTTTATSTGEVLGTSTNTTATGTDAVCTPLLIKYLRPLGRNDANEVRKLQVFLNQHEGESIEETGFFGRATRAAVERFQLKYADEVLLPWLEFGHRSIRVATGIVYKMTLWKVNALHCEEMGLPAPEPPQIP